MSKMLPQFGSYEATRRLGAGGMAETFVAVRRGPGGFEQKVCIKRVLPAYAEDQDFVDGFLREARTSAALRHANIVQVVDFGHADDSYYLALELVDGLDLRALIAPGSDGVRPRMRPELVVLIAGELAAALAHAHAGSDEREPVVHRDLSPSNVLVSPAGEVKLTDFGIARALGGTHFTATGIIKGKIPYLPPEYVERGQFDRRGDLFSLGVLLFELLAGERPFDGESDLETIRRIASGERSRLRDLVPDVPPPLATCVERLIASNPAERFASAPDFLEALPGIYTHAARRELGNLVEARMKLGRLSGRVPAKPLAASFVEDPAQAQTVAIPSPLASPATKREDHDVPSDVPTRTRKPNKPPPTPPSGQLWALGLAAAALFALLFGFAIKRHFRVPGARAASSPPLPPPEALATHAPSVHQAATSASAQTPAAAVHVQAFADEASAEAAPGMEDEALNVRASARSQRATADLKIVVFPFGDVWIDGKPLGHAPVTSKQTAGTHEIAVGDGRPEQRRVVQLHAGSHESLVFRREEAR